jgi:hypothetical protein
MKDSEYITRNEPMEATFPPIILIPDSIEDGETSHNFEELRSHLRMCERLLQLPSTHLCGADRYTVEMAMDNPDSYQRQFVEKLYAAREREAHLRCENWEGGAA